MRAMEDSSSSHGELVSTLALPLAAGLHVGDFLRPTTRASDTVRPSHSNEMGFALFLSCELLPRFDQALELLHRDHPTSIILISKGLSTPWGHP